MAISFFILIDFYIKMVYYYMLEKYVKLNLQMGINHCIYLERKAKNLKQIF